MEKEIQVYGIDDAFFIIDTLQLCHFKYYNYNGVSIDIVKLDIISYYNYDNYDDLEFYIHYNTETLEYVTVTKRITKSENRIKKLLDILK